MAAVEVLPPTVQTDRQTDRQVVDRQVVDRQTGSGQTVVLVSRAA